MNGWQDRHNGLLWHQGILSLANDRRVVLIDGLECYNRNRRPQPHRLANTCSHVAELGQMTGSDATLTNDLIYFLTDLLPDIRILDKVV